MQIGRWENESGNDYDGTASNECGIEYLRWRLKNSIVKRKKVRVFEANNKMVRSVKRNL